MRFAISMCLTPPNPAAQRRPADLVAIRFVLPRIGFPGGRPARWVRFPRTTKGAGTPGRVQVPGGAWRRRLTQYHDRRRDARIADATDRLTLGDDAMQYHAINFAQKLGLFTEHWQPKVIAEMNDYQFKIVKLQGDFIWHDHRDTDETFIVLDGTLRIDFRNGSVHVGSGEMFVVPKGVEHKPYAEDEVKLLLIEPRGVLNTGHEGGERTAQNDVWI